MVSHDQLYSAVTSQFALDQRDSYLTPKFELAMDRCCQALVSKLETLDSITFYLTVLMCSFITCENLYESKISDSCVSRRTQSIIMNVYGLSNSEF